VINTLEEHNIESRPVWKPMHLQPVFEKYPFFTAEKEKPFGEAAFETGLCLPSGTGLDLSDQKRVIIIVKEWLIKQRQIG
jgi:pyridoxal phosphate-dependent aminotransferase EpsN